MFREEELAREGETEEQRQNRAAALRADGRGFNHGCRIPSDIPHTTLFEALLHAFARDPRNVVRTVPSWVPVAGEEMKEVEGVAIRSYQTWTDAPLFQWHHWYDWNVFIAPAPGYGFLRGAANRPPVLEPDDPKFNAGFTQIAIRDFDGKGAHTMEVEFDCGVFGARFRKEKISKPQSFGPMMEEDWAWPITGQYCWATGRWIYDCGHPTTDEKKPLHDEIRLKNGNIVTGDIVRSGPLNSTIELMGSDGNRKSLEIPADQIAEERVAGRTRSELHPMRALATARWEAVKFKENGDLFVPGIQFMFFASNIGGYWPLPNLKGAKYEFIVDLPKYDVEQRWTIGHTPEFPLNTGVLKKPKLLFDFDFKPFRRAIDKTKLPGNFLGSTEVKPQVEVIQPDDPNKPPEQAKVTISLDGISASDAFYGVIISFGWHDPDRSLARRVKTVTVNVSEYRTGGPHFKGPNTGRWQLRVGVNGRWQQSLRTNVKVLSRIGLGHMYELHLADDETVQVSAHGEETWRVHETYSDRSDPQRILKFTLLTPGLGQIFGPASAFIPLATIPTGIPVEYDKHCVRGDGVTRRLVVTSFLLDQASTFADESQPLGRIDPFHEVPGSSINPIPVKSLTEAPQSFKLIALQTSEVGKSAELAENPSNRSLIFDYQLHFTVSAVDQQIPAVS